MWVADMDFRPPTAVTEALTAAVAHGVYGYFGDDRAYKSAITGWMDRRHGWTVDPRPSAPRMASSRARRSAFRPSPNRATG